MPDLLTFQQREFSNVAVISNELELVRRDISTFFNAYHRYGENLDHLIDNLNRIITVCKIPVPLILINLFGQSDRLPDLNNNNKRDHILHSLNLFCFGALLISHFPCISQKLDTCSLYDKIKRWAFCALLHDIGYIETCDESLRENLNEQLISAVRTIPFQLVCALDHDSALTVYFGPECEQREDFQVITAPARLLIDREFYHPQVSLSPSTVVTSGQTYADYFANQQTDHGNASAVILSICRRIAEAIISNPRNFEQQRLPPPNLYLWHGLENPIQAIQLHTQYRANSINEQHLVNPWIPFLYLMDNLTEYDRPYRRQDNHGQMLSIENIRIDDIEGRPMLYYPSAYRNNSIVTSPHLQSAASIFDISLTSY